MDKMELYALFSGKVQGVGFRYTIQDYALDLGLTGFARNLPNGKVELVAQGTKEALTALLQEIQTNPHGAKIDRVNADFRSIDKILFGFKIL